MLGSTVPLIKCIGRLPESIGSKVWCTKSCPVAESFLSGCWVSAWFGLFACLHVLQPSCDIDMLTCCCVLACSVWHHVNEVFAPDRLKLRSSVGVVLSSLPVLMSPSVTMSHHQVSVALSIEDFCMELLCTCGNHMQARVPATPCDCFLLLGSGISQVLQSWHTCFKLTLYGNLRSATVQRSPDN